LLDKNATVSEPRYGLPVEELDFIINYDIKYRMGGSDDHDDDDEA